MVVNENKMAFCEKWKQMTDRNGTSLAECAGIGLGGVLPEGGKEKRLKINRLKKFLINL